jgi:hypothetical protein
MSIMPTVHSLAGVGVTLLSSDPLELQCNKCKSVWQPGRLSSGRLPPGWWKCPNDPGHTLDMDIDRITVKNYRRSPGTQELDSSHIRKRE